MNVSGKIGGLGSGAPDSVAGGAAVPPRGSGGSGQAAPGSPTESVQITDTASQLAALEQTLRGMPAVDQARVDAVRSAIEQGTYQIAPQHIADQLAQMEQSLASLARPGKSRY